MLSAVRSTVARHVRRSAPAQQLRAFSLGHSGPPPEWDGIDKVVRSYFPEDYQLSIAILSGYFGIYVLFKISSAFSSKKPEIEEAKPVVTTTVTTGIPALDSPAFDTFLETPAFEQLLENEEQLAKVVESA